MVKLTEIIRYFNLEIITCGDEAENIYINSNEVNRPGLQLYGFYEYFSRDRIQIIGRAETAFLSDLYEDERKRSYEKYFSLSFPALIVSRGLEIDEELKKVSQKYKTPVLRTKESTSRFLSSLIGYLNEELAEKVNKHGVFVEVYGEGILILGDSGVGKSETALELVKRGHRLVADDLVEIKKVSEKSLIGSAPEVLKHFIEIRGIGILDVKNLYGVGSIKLAEKVNLVVKFEFWDPNKIYERVGTEEEYIDILGINLPLLVVPVRPGRNLAIVVEVADMNNRQKKMGYNAAKSFTEKVFKAPPDTDLI